MNERQIYVTVSDMDRLGRLVLAAISNAPDLEPLRALDRELDRAQAVRPEEVPPDVITMNSKLRMTDLQSGTQRIVTLVYPDQANDADRVSILSPLGTALLGYRVGDEIRWETPTGDLHLRIDELLYQP
ncbi:MAG: nucleoside diphosphate kinase regulator, partial [Gemmatimonadaceae bacterium]|nr:nucleoside diphosphate kinase regulator [Gemmatimonadaceae bacterium]